jgi:hypothetical protein
MFVVAGPSGMEGLAQLGDPFTRSADQARGEVDRVLLGRRDQRGDEPRHQRQERGAELENPVDQANGMRLSKSTALPQCHLLPPRRLGSLPGLPQINPHECLKHHISYPLLGQCFLVHGLVHLAKSPTFLRELPQFATPRLATNSLVHKYT